MHDAGVVVSFNSDDAEMGRRLNLEAAKAVKFGGVPPEEALKFVTLNPARQLRIDKWVGSLEPGKQADLVVWSGDPCRFSHVASKPGSMAENILIWQKIVSCGPAIGIGTPRWCNT